MKIPANKSWPNYEAPKSRILYVGSDLELLAALRKAFSKPEYHIVGCPDGRSAIVFLRSDIPYCLFIFDLEMQDAAALELTRLARSLSQRAHTGHYRNR